MAAQLLLQLKDLIPKLLDIDLLFLDLFLNFELRLLRFIGRSVGRLGGVADGRESAGELAVR